MSEANRQQAALRPTTDVVQRVNTNGDSTPMYEYDAFGNQREENTDDPNPFRYCGEYYDKETETYYLRARNYDSRTGRFGQEDRIRSGRNWYSYCGGNPIKWADPSGNTVKAAQTKQPLLNSLMKNITSIINSAIAAAKEKTSKNSSSNIADADYFYVNPGLFETIDDAAMDFGMRYNEESIEAGREYGTQIYSVEKTVLVFSHYEWIMTIWGMVAVPIYKFEKKTFYTYKIITIGDERSIGILYDKNEETVAYAHTHGPYTDSGRNIISYDDIVIARNKNVPIYAVTPEGKLLVYDPETNTMSLINDDMPRDPNSPVDNWPGDMTGW